MSNYRDLDWEMFTGHMFSREELDEIYEQGRAEERSRIINELKAEIDKYQKYNYPENDYESGFEEGCEFAFRKAVMIV